ncbi:hypothetical protein OEA41_000400 [Lepraria neglecta]|uniref:Uncharacterized protein n=1 Tax=Lepraria neglecta TaxID=209136 RepID=A0AAD9ZIW5_9LECA|nr:hypothetical protein OEA41_000400 [Lepraria neglecta]
MPYHQDNWATPGYGRGNAASRDPYQGLPRSTTIPHPDDPGFAPFAPYPANPEGYRNSSRNSTYGSVDDRLSPETRAGEFLSSLSPPRRENWSNSRSPDDIAMTGQRDYPTSTISPRAGHSSSYSSSGSLGSHDWGSGQLSGTSSSFQSPYSPSSSIASYETLRSLPGSAPGHSQADTNMQPQSSASTYPWETGFQFSQDVLDPTGDRSSSRGTITVHGSKGDKRRSKTYRGGRDEFEGSIQFLEKPRRAAPEHREQDLPLLPIHLDQGEQDSVLSKVNRRLSQCAFDWVAEYRFPIPLEPNKPAVQTASDKEWTEWNYLIKRLATKRKIPTHAVYDGQIKELTTVLDNALEMRHTTKPQARPLKDDRHVLQFISAGIQVGKMLKDAATMEYLDKLYQQTERVIHERSTAPPYTR